MSALRRGAAFLVVAPFAAGALALAACSDDGGAPPGAGDAAAADADVDAARADGTAAPPDGGAGGRDGSADGAPDADAVDDGATAGDADAGHADADAGHADAGDATVVPTDAAATADAGDAAAATDAGDAAAPSPWSLVGGTSGTPVSVGIAPSSGATPYVVYVGTSGAGVFHSADGTTWTTTGPASVVSVSAMPQAAVCFAGLADGSVQVTKDSGGTWAATPGSPNAVVRGWIGVAGVGPLGASSNGAGSAVVFQGKSSGATWVASSPFGTGTATSLAFGGGTSPNVVVYAAVSGAAGGVFKSTDVGGATFDFATTGFPQTDVLSVATAPSSPSVVFAGTNGQGAGVYVSANGGATWSAAGTGLGDTTVHALAVDPTNANDVYAGTGAGVYVSKDGGATWTLSGLGGGAVTALAVLNGAPATVYAATTAGLYVTTTGGT